MSFTSKQNKFIGKLLLILFFIYGLYNVIVGPAANYYSVSGRPVIPNGRIPGTVYMIIALYFFYYLYKHKDFFEDK